MIRKTTIRNYLVPGLLLIALFNGLVKALTGIRYFPLIIDFALLALLMAIVLFLITQKNPTIGVIDALAISFIALAAAWMFHPNIPSFAAGLEGFRKFAFMIVGLLIGRYWFRTQESLVILTKALIFPVTLIAIYGIKQYLFPTPLDYRLIELSTSSPGTYLMGGHIRAFSTLSGPFHLGILLVGSALLILSLLISGIKRKPIYVIIFLIQITALIMTVTKSNMFALVAGSLVLVLVLTKRPLRTVKRLIFLALLSGVILLIAFSATANNPQFKTVHQGIQDLISPAQAKTFQFRIGLWQEEVLPLIAESPWVGYGTGSAGEGLEFYFENTSSKYIGSHNLFFKVIFEMGVLGLLIFILLLGSCIVTLFAQLKWLQTPFYKAFNAWALAFTAGVLVAGLTGAILDAYPPNLLFWIVLGIATRLPVLERSTIHVKAASTVHAFPTSQTSLPQPKI
jgi:O-antigen ligase